MRIPLSALLLLAALSGTPTVTAQSVLAVPQGWLLAGDKPQAYSTGIEANGTAFLASRTSSPTGGFGTLMQVVRADNYAGKRIRFQASVRSENVTGWAGLWMRIDKGKQVVVLDNMQDRPIKGSSSWKTYDVVLNVPPDATSISFGSLVDSSGGIWLKDLSFEVVSADVPLTAGAWDGKLPLTPVNLTFRNN